MFKKYMCLALCLLLALGTMTTTASAASLAVDGLVVSHVSFADANGPVTDLPETASSVTASVTVSNNSAVNSSVVLAMGKFVDDVLVDIKYDQKTLTANEQNVAFSATLDNVAKDEVTKDGTTYDRTVLKAFVWTKVVGGKALAAPATLPSDDTSFVFVTKNGVIWDGFDASVTEQTIELPRTEGVPSIKFFPKDNATKIDEPAKFALGKNTVKVTSAQGTEKTYNLNLKYEDPAVDITMGTVNGATAPMIKYSGAKDFSGAREFGPEARPFSDRTQFTAAWVGEGLLGGNYFVGTVGRDDATKNVQKGDGTYFSFTANASGTMYVIYKSALDSYARKGWTLENNSQPAWSGGTSQKTPYDQPTDKPFFMGYIQWRNDACVGQQFDENGELAEGPDANDATKIVKNAQYANAYPFTYSLKFNAGEQVDVPTANQDFGQYGSNLVMVVKWENPNPDLSSDSTLKSLTYATDGAAQAVPGFNNTQSGNVTYDKIVLAEGTTSVTVNAEANDANATVLIDGAAVTSKVVDLTSGSATVVVSVQPEDPALAASKFTIPFEVEGDTPPVLESDAILLDESNGALKSDAPKATVGTTLLETTMPGTYEYVKGVALEAISDRTEEFVLNGDGKNYGYTWTLSSEDYKPGAYNVYVKGTSYGGNGADSFFIVLNEEKFDAEYGNMFKAPSSTTDDPNKDVATREHIELNWVKAFNQVVIPENGSYTLRVTGRESPFIDKVILIPSDSDLTIDAAEAELCKEYTATFAVDGATVATVLYDDSVVGTAVPTKGWVLNTETNKSVNTDVPALVVPEKEGFTAAWAPATLQADGTEFVADYKAAVTALFEDDFEGYGELTVPDRSKWSNVYKYNTSLTKEENGNHYASMFAAEREDNKAFEMYPRLEKRIDDVDITKPFHFSGRVLLTDGTIKPVFMLDFRKDKDNKAVMLTLGTNGIKAFDTAIGTATSGQWLNFDVYLKINSIEEGIAKDAEVTVVITGEGLKNAAGQPINRLVGKGTKDVSNTALSNSMLLLFNTEFKNALNDPSETAKISLDDIRVYNDEYPVLSSNAKLSALTYAPNGSNPAAVPGFSAANEGGTYTVDLDAGTTSVTLGATTADENATKAVLVNGQVVENGVVTISGATTAVVSVVAEDGTKNDFTVNFTVSGAKNEVTEITQGAAPSNPQYAMKAEPIVFWTTSPYLYYSVDEKNPEGKYFNSSTKEDENNPGQIITVPGGTNVGAGVFKDTDTQPFFEGATVIRRDKNDGAGSNNTDAKDKPYWGKPGYDGSTGTYWLTFKVSDDATVYVVDREGKGWPNADKSVWKLSKFGRAGKPMYYQKVTAGSTVQIPNYGWDDTWSPSTEAGKKYFYDPSQYVVVWGSQSPEDVVEENKIQGLTVSADSANAVYDKNNGYNLGEVTWDSPVNKVMIEDGIKLGSANDANATQKYSERKDRFMNAKEYDPYFAGATIIRRPKGDGGSAADVHAGKKKYFTANSNDGKDGRGYWMEFTVSSDCTVFTSGSFKRTWPNKPADWTETTSEYLLFDGQPTVYYKEYKAGDRVQIPSFGYDDAWASDNEWFDPPVYVVVWDSEGKTNPDKNRSTDTKLSALTYKVGENDPATVTGFDPADVAPKTYNVRLEEGATSVTLSAARADQRYGKTVITVDGVEKTDGVIAVSGDAPTTAVVTVTAHDGTTTGEYSVTFTVGGDAPVLSTNTKLSALTYAPNGSDVATVPGFSAADAGKTYDKITLAAGTTSVTVGATVADTGKATYAVKVGEEVKDGGVVAVSSAADTTVNVVVTAEDTTVTDTYTLVFAVTPDEPAPSNTVSNMTYADKAPANNPKVVDIVRGTTQAYGSAGDCEVHNITSEEFDVAGSVIQRVKGEAGVIKDSKYFVGDYDGVEPNPYWMTFTMDAPGTVYIVDMEGKGWPNNNGRWEKDTTGLTFGLWGTPYNMASGKLYSKHFNAGETVEVPNYGYDPAWGADTERLFTNPSIYLILWDSALPKSASLKSLTYTVEGEEAAAVTDFVSGSPSGTYNVGVSSANVKIAAEAITNSNAEVTFSSNVAADGTITFVDGAAQVVVTVKSADKSKTNTYTVNFSVDPMFGAKTYDVPQREGTKIDILVNPDLVALRANSGNNEIKPTDPIDNFSKLYGDRGAGLPGSGADKIGMSFIDVGTAIKGATQIIDPIGDTRTAAIRDGFTSKDNEYFRFRATEKGTVYVKSERNIASYDADPSWTKVVEAGLTPSGINDWKGNGMPEDYVHNTTQFPYYFNLYQNATTDKDSEGNPNPNNYHTKYTTTYYKTFEADEVVSIRTIASTANQNLVTLIQWGDVTTSYDSSLKSLTYNGVSVPNFKATEARYTVYSTTTDPVAIAAVQTDANATLAIDKESLTPSAEGDMATITVTSSVGTTRYYVTVKLTTEENKIVNLSTASKAGIYGVDGYNTDKTKQTDKYTIEDDLNIGTPADGDTPAVNGDFGYNDRNNVRYTSDTSSFFKGATYIRTSKNDAGDVMSKRPYFSGNFDGKNGNPYWVEFVVTSDATVYFADTYYWNDQTSKDPAVQAMATPWPNKPAEWLVAQPTDDLAIHGTAFHGTPETGSVYYRHYKAGEVVQIPCYGVPSTWAADRVVYDPPVYLIVWDSDRNTNPDGGVDDGGDIGGGSGNGGGTEDGGNQ